MPFIGTTCKVSLNNYFTSSWLILCDINILCQQLLVPCKIAKVNNNIFIFWPAISNIVTELDKLTLKYSQMKHLPNIRDKLKKLAVGVLFISAAA